MIERGSDFWERVRLAECRVLTALSGGVPSRSTAGVPSLLSAPRSSRSPNPDVGVGRG
jgi:hypothetical protein